MRGVCFLRTTLPVLAKAGTRRACVWFTYALSLPIGPTGTPVEASAELQNSSKAAVKQSSERVSLEHQNGVNQLSLISRNGRKLGRNQQISAELWSIVGVGSSGHRLNLSTECGTNETVQGHTLGGQIHGRSQFHLHSGGNGLFGHWTFP